MIVDFHTYAYPTDLTKEVFSRLEKEANLTPSTNGTLDALKKSMVGNKVDISVILPIAYDPAQVSVINDWVSELRFHEETIVPFGTIHAKTTNYKQALKDLRYRRVKGIKVHPAYQGFSMEDDNTLLVLYAAAMEGLIIYIHMGDSFGTSDPGFSIPYLKYLIKELDGAKIIASHFGGFKQWDQVEQTLCGEDIYFDTSLMIGNMDKQLVRQIMNKHGHDKILFGSGTPFADPSEYFRFFKLLNLDKRIESAIYYNNAAKLLGIEV